MPAAKVTAWNNGRHCTSGAGYGLKLAAGDRDRLFDRAWKSAVLKLPDGRDEIHVNIAKRSFWDTNCSELIHKEIGRWLLDAGLAPWPYRQPPKFNLECVGKRRFRVTNNQIAQNRKRAVELRLDLDEDDFVQEIFDRDGVLFFVTKKKIIRLRSPEHLDPGNEHEDVPWEQSVYLPHGSTDYAVARTIIQTDRIASIFFPKQSSKYVAMMDVSWEVMNSIVSLRFLRERLEQQVNFITKKIKNNWAPYTVGANPVPLPTVDYLDIEFRSFVNEVRRTLTKIGELFGILTPKTINSGHFHKALEWAREAKGENHELTKMLERDLRWIETWIAIRIAIEHPKVDEFVGTMNFSLEPDRTIRLPTWRFVHPKFDMMRPQNLLDVFHINLHNLLKFFEDLQVVLTDGHQPPNMGVEYTAIEEDLRDPEMPMRFDIQVHLGI